MTMPRTLYQHFADTAESHPDAVAVEINGFGRTYRDLHDDARRLAGRIVDVTGPHDRRPVGVLAARSALAYAGYLAVQSLGRPVVPLNPVFPIDRNAAIAAAADLSLVLTDDEALLIDRLPVRTLTNHSAVDGASAPAGPQDPDDVAYILFTSGSTGAPKGVPIRHRNVSGYLEHMARRCQARPGSRFSQTFDPTFDPSVFDMFVPWTVGATVVVPTREEVADPVQFVTACRITHWFSVPSVVSLASRLRRLPAESMPDLRWSLFAGEALTAVQARAWHAAAPQSVLENIYGPTELTITCTAYRLPAEERHWLETGNGTVPIGTLNPGLEHHIVGGELVVRGMQRFSGYLDSAQNAGRFLRPDLTDSLDAGEAVTDRHWYRTGDRVADTDGVLVHLGRLDQQVQVQGYRVELGEVESALRDSAGATDAVVLAQTGRAGQVELVAAWTGGDTDPERVAAVLRRRLPHYMVPISLTRLNALPLNDNGKIDRHAVGAAVCRATREDVR
jgi:amino acid adenylation domain-containing protein